MQAIQDVQIGASDDKVWTQLPQNFVNLDYDNGDHTEDEGIQRLTKELSILSLRSEEVEDLGGEVPRRDGFPC